jgi:DNA-binding NarL/FixJ family response regulator
LIIVDNSSKCRRFCDLREFFASAALLPPVKSQGRVLLGKSDVDVARPVVDGNTIEDVCEIPGATERTVSNSLFDRYAQLGISPRVELVRCSLWRQS